MIINTDKIKEEEKILLLIESLRILNLIPGTGNGRVEVIFQDNLLLDLNKQERTRIKCAIN